MRFKFWPILLLILVIPLLHRWWTKKNMPPAMRLPVRIPASVTRAHPVRWMLVLRYLSLLFLIVALARPQTGNRSLERRAEGIDIMLVLDVSRSMDIEDLAEESRFEIARATMRQFIQGRSSDRIGLVIFSGEPLTLAPPTLDYGLVLSALGSAETGSLKDGTAIGDGLTLAVNRLKNSRAKSRVIVLLTDGDNNVGQVDPATAGDISAGYGIRVYTIAVGTEGKVKLPVVQKGIFGQTIRTFQWMDNALNPVLLQKIAEQTQGKFYRVTDAKALRDVFTEIDRLEKTEVKAMERIQYDEHYALPLLLSLCMLLAEQMLAIAWWRWAA